MPPYSGPSKERSTYGARFIRVEDRLYTGEPGDESVTHKELAKQDGLLDSIQCLKEENPREVDAGRYLVSGRDIVVTGDSLTLGIPDEFVETESRSKTVSLFEVLSPGCHIIKSRW